MCTYIYIYNIYIYIYVHIYIYIHTHTPTTDLGWGDLGLGVNVKVGVFRNSWIRGPRVSSVRISVWGLRVLPAWQWIFIADCNHGGLSVP